MLQIIFITLLITIINGELSNYGFGYNVHDLKTGDIKSHHEFRNGDNVNGFYTLIEPNGKRRTVEYHADKYSGFNAVVKNDERYQYENMNQPLIVGHKLPKANKHHRFLPLSHQFAYRIEYANLPIKTYTNINRY